MLSGLRYSLIGGALAIGYRTGLHRLAARWTGGLGAILTLHHVRPASGQEFSPSALLEITPEFLDKLLSYLKGEGFDLIAMDEVPTRLAAGSGRRRFVALTFDDGYRDNAEFALPVLRRHGAPCTVYVAKGFAERTANMWWRDIEAIIRREDRLRCRIGETSHDLPCRTLPEKNAAYRAIYWPLRALDDVAQHQAVAALKADYPVDSAADVGRMCMDWDELARFAADPLVTIGAHTLTHPRLAGCTAEAARAEIVDSAAAIRDHLGIVPRHIAYPFGDRHSAGQREFAMAGEAGFATGVTTRPGVLFPEHAAHLAALPRISVNGYFQQVPFMATLLSGLPFAAMRRGRRLDVA